MRIVILSAAALLAVAPARADLLRPFTIGVTGGSLGIGPEASYQFNPLLAVRGSATFFGLSGHARSDGFRYTGHARISNFGGTVDVHPLLNGFRLSAGARSTQRDRIRFAARSTRDMTYSGMAFTPDQIGMLSGVIHTRSVSPIVTAGYARSGLSGITFGIDAGVMFHGTPRPQEFSATGELADPIAAAEYASQQQRVRDEVDGYKYYPVVQVSLGYRF